MTKLQIAGEEERNAVLAQEGEVLVKIKSIIGTRTHGHKLIRNTFTLKVIKKKFLMIKEVRFWTSLHPGIVRTKTPTLF